MYTWERPKENWVTHQGGLEFKLKYRLTREGGGGHEVGLLGERRWFLRKMSGPWEE